jgi:hypothetical protein
MIDHALEQGPMPYAAECEIEQMGATWIASFDFAASRCDDGWALDEFAVEIVDKDHQAANAWTAVDFTELSEAAQQRIEQAALHELSSIQYGDLDPADDERGADWGDEPPRVQ